MNEEKGLSFKDAWIMFEVNKIFEAAGGFGQAWPKEYQDIFKLKVREALLVIYEKGYDQAVQDS